MRARTRGRLPRKTNSSSRCNAVRHGLTAETVIGVLEVPKITKRSKRPLLPIMTSAVGRELVLRLASLLWRLRRVAVTGFDHNPALDGMTDPTETAPDSGMPNLPLIR